MGLRLNNSSVYMRSRPCYAITMIIAINNLTQLDVLETHQWLLILALDRATMRAGAASHCSLGLLSPETPKKPQVVANTMECVQRDGHQAKDMPIMTLVFNEHNRERGTLNTALGLNVVGRVGGFT